MSAKPIQLKPEDFIYFCPQKGAVSVRQKLSSGNCVGLARTVPFCY